MSVSLSSLLDDACSALSRMDASALNDMAAEAELIAAECRMLGSIDIGLLLQRRDRFRDLLDSTRCSLYLISHMQSEEGASQWAR